MPPTTTNQSQHDQLQQQHPPLPEFSRYIPLRLNKRERSLLNVLESTLGVSEYTDNIDVSLRRVNNSSKQKRILEGIYEALYIATGLATCGRLDSVMMHDDDEEDVMMNGVKEVNGVKNGLKKKKNGKHNQIHNTPSPPTNKRRITLASRTPSQNAKFFQEIFEIGRRHKILNPSKARNTYGKLMYLLQDSQSPAVANSLGFSLCKDLLLVGPYLDGFMGGSDLLADERLVDATVCINGWKTLEDGTQCKLSREEVEGMVHHKRKMREELIFEYSSLSIKCLDDDHNHNNNKQKPCLQAADIERCIDSISDAVSVTASNMKPPQRMLQLLTSHFSPTLPLSKKNKHSDLTLTPTPPTIPNNHTRFGVSGFSSIHTPSTQQQSSSGTTLSHSHSSQYNYVLQSLTLWTLIQKNMHRLWVMADADLLSNPYQLWNTGQGLNRVQSCPKVRNVMTKLLHNTIKVLGVPWVGLSVIHLGDRDVPNALIFIDKYTQIPRFLQPICDFIDSLPDLCNSNKGIEEYVQREFNSCGELKQMVLCDYFKFGFDGSGDDGGSCIDGRLTSSWNWTSEIGKKSYYHVLLLNGFQGFDGDDGFK